MPKISLRETVKRLSDVGIDSAKEEARIIFESLGGFRSYELIGGNAETDSERVLDAIKRREAREPLQYVIGEVEFFREYYKVTPDVLIPRADTEILVEYAVKNLPEGARFLDLCTGSGAVAVSTLKNTKGTKAIATDIHPATVEVAKENAERNGVIDRIEFLIEDALGKPSEKILSFKPYALLSNPPYVCDGVYETLEKEIFFEPKRAFVGGEDGANFYRAITENYRSVIAPDGFIAYEIGYDQAELVSNIAENSKMNCEIYRDLSGNPRLAVLKNR